MKRGIIAAIITMLLVIGICPISSVEASKKSDAYEGYYNWIEKHGDYIGFKLVNIDKDGIPELVSMKDDGYGGNEFALCSYDGDKVNDLNLYYNFSGSMNVNAVIFPKKGKIIYITYYPGNGEETRDFYTVKNGIIKKKHTAKQAREAKGHTFDGKSISQEEYDKKTNISKATWFADLKYISKKKMQKKLSK